MAKQSNTLVVPQAQAALDRLKYEIASEYSIQLSEGYNGNLTTREAGTVGGNITKKLVQIAEQSLSGGTANNFKRF